MSTNWKTNTVVTLLDPVSLKIKSWDIFPSLGSLDPPDNEHIEVLTQALSKNDPGYWNDWRKNHPSIQPNLSGIVFPSSIINNEPVGVVLQDFNFNEAQMKGVSIQYAELINVGLERANLRESLIIQSNITNCRFINTDLTQTSLAFTNVSDSKFIDCDLSRTLLFSSNYYKTEFNGSDFEHADIRSSEFEECTFGRSKLHGSNCSGSEFYSCNMTFADFSGCVLNGAKLIGSDISNSLVYGVNAWDVEIDEETIQRNLYIDNDGPSITVDNIKIAQFLHTILSISEISNVLNTLSGKAVLILGRFSEERLSILEAIAIKLRTLDDLPIIFNFDKPVNMNTSETIRIIAGLSKFIIADLTDPKSTPYESHLIIPDIAVPFFPIINTGQKAFAMFEDLYDYPWLLDGFEYNNKEHLIENIEAIRNEALLKKEEIKNRRNKNRKGFRKSLDKN